MIPARHVSSLRRVACVVVAVACMVGAALAPAAAQAGPVPTWESHDLSGLDLGLPPTPGVAVVRHGGRIYAALRAGDSAILVRRYDSELDTWLPVGGAIARTLDARATQPRLVSERDELYLTYTEIDSHDRPSVIVARLTERGQRSSWQIVQPLAGSAASLVHVDDRLWVVWRGRDGRVHLARLQEAGVWDVSETTLRAPALGRSHLPQALEFQGAIYVLYRVDHAWRPHVGGHPLQPPPNTQAVIVERVDVTRGRDAPSELLTTLATTGSHIRSANLTPVPGGRPLLTWGYRIDAVHYRLRFEELSIDGHRFLPIGEVHSASTDVVPFVFAATPEEILLGDGVNTAGGTWRASLRLLHRASIGNDDGPMRDELVARMGGLVDGAIHALLLPRGEVLTIVATRIRLFAELHTPRAIAPPER